MDSFPVTSNRRFLSCAAGPFSISDLEPCVSVTGVVTAELFQCKQDSDIMSKMVEELDEVETLFSSGSIVSVSMFVTEVILIVLDLWQGSGLQYKKFLAFPWILTVTWPLDMVSLPQIIIFFFYIMH